MNFHTAYLKLTAFYVLIVMTISLAFSVSIYRIASDELDRGLGRQSRILQDIPITQLPRTFQDLEDLRQQQIDESNQHLQLTLLYFNLLILAIASGLSYYFAKRTLQPIEDAVEAQNRFTADASHELRTPLTAMRSEIEVNLRDKDLKLPEAKALLQSNLEEIEKLESLSNALLKLARSEKAEKTGFEPASLSEIITEAYEKVESLAQMKSIEFKNNISDIEIMGDKQSLVELFVILLDNAIKYSLEKSKIFIATGRENHFALVGVKDEGVGIKASDIPYIFNRFYRADTSRSKEKISGYGLGLSIAKQITDLHNGTITVESKPGKGSEFIVRLPLAE